MKKLSLLLVLAIIASTLFVVPMGVSADASVLDGKLLQSTLWKNTTGATRTVTYNSVQYPIISQDSGDNATTVHTGKVSAVTYTLTKITDDDNGHVKMAVTGDANTEYSNKSLGGEGHFANAYNKAISAEVIEFAFRVKLGNEYSGVGVTFANSASVVKGIPFNAASSSTYPNGVSHIDAPELTVGEWYDVRIVVPLTGADPQIELYINEDKEVSDDPADGYAQKFAAPSYGGTLAQKNFNFFNFYAPEGQTSEVYLDDIYLNTYATPVSILGGMYESTTYWANKNGSTRFAGGSYRVIGNELSYSTQPTNYNSGFSTTVSDTEDSNKYLKVTTTGTTQTDSSLKTNSDAWYNSTAKPYVVGLQTKVSGDALALGFKVRLKDANSGVGFAFFNKDYTNNPTNGENKLNSVSINGGANASYMGSNWNNLVTQVVTPGAWHDIKVVVPMGDTTESLELHVDGKIVGMYALKNKYIDGEINMGSGSSHGGFYFYSKEGVESVVELDDISMKTYTSANTDVTKIRADGTDVYVDIMDTDIVEVDGLTVTGKVILVAEDASGKIVKYAVSEEVADFETLPTASFTAFLDGVNCDKLYAYYWEMADGSNTPWIAPISYIVFN